MQKKKKFLMSYDSLLKMIEFDGFDLLSFTFAVRGF